MSETPPVKHLWPNFWRLLKPYWVSPAGRKGWLLLVVVLVPPMLLTSLQPTV